MTVLEGNQAYRAAMVILKTARLVAAAEENDYTHKLIYDAQTHLTAQETRDMKAGFQ
jgi:hypothetical protein